MTSHCEDLFPGVTERPRASMRSAYLAAVFAVVAGCATSTADYLAEQEGYTVFTGFVIQLSDLHSPKITKLKDGVAYEVTAPGCTVVLEGNRGRRTLHELNPGDLFVQGRPYAFVLKRR